MTVNTAPDPSRRARTGVAGFDEIASGGLPRERITAVLGSAGSGKTVFALQCISKGAADFGEPGIFVAFEESPEHLLENASTFTWSPEALRDRGVEFVDARLSQSILVAGEFDLVGLFAVLGARVKRMGAKRIVFDGVDLLLGQLGDPLLVRRETLRLREWILESGLTAIITARYDDAMVRLGTEPHLLMFVADCVVKLEHRVDAGTASRALRVKKYRGGRHSANEQPFSISETGVEISSGVDHAHSVPVSNERVSSGVERLDTMLQGGHFRGSSVLISGAPGTAKTSFAAAFAVAACARGERTLYVSFDEAPDQLARNVASIGIDCATHVASGALRLCGLRTRTANPEAHMAHIRALLREHGARNLVIDPLSALVHVGGGGLATEYVALQLLDLARSQGITTISTSLLASANPLTEETPLGISTLADTWMHLSYVVAGGERNRALTIIKGRGTNHSNQVRELILSDEGMSLADVYTVDGEVLMGTLRWQRENEEARRVEGERRRIERELREAELALAETKARGEAILRERALREAELARLQREGSASAQRRSLDDEGSRRRRRADEVPAATPEEKDR
jgi:circadian clock protein KaiC